MTVLEKFIKSYVFPYGLKWSEIYNKETDSFLIEEVDVDYVFFKGVNK